MGLKTQQLGVFAMASCRELARFDADPFRVGLSPDGNELHVLGRSECTTLRTRDGAPLRVLELPPQPRHGHMPSFPTEFHDLSPTGDALLHITQDGITRIALDGRGVKPQLRLATPAASPIVLPQRDETEGDLYLVQRTHLKPQQDGEQLEALLEVWSMA